MRATVRGVIDDEQAAFLLNETEKKWTAVQKEQPKKDLKQTIYIEGRVGKEPMIDKSETNVLFCYFTLAQKTEDPEKPIWHHVFLWEGELTIKLGLTDKGSITKYFEGIKKGDFF